MKIHKDIEQNSCDWSILRSGKVTASESDALVTPLGKVKTGDGPKTLMIQKLAERWIGGPLPSLNVWDMDQGKILEESGRPAFEFHTGLKVETVGFFESDCGRYGCSPDGMCSDGAGLELKSPRLDTHIRYLLDGIVPTEYVLQVQMSLFVTGYSKWYFCSFRRHFPLLVVEVPPDEKIQSAIKEALAGFSERLDASYARLIELNGGPPQRAAVLEQYTPPAAPEMEGITP